ncbi:MAG: hypothetical protein E7596_01655 [Ruminococcaceae bacterium]|nr:hypothetical protein [Oscillospiraceae bacterium]
MKKILAVTLAVLMLLPVFASLVNAEMTIPEGVKSENIASDAKIEIIDTNSLGIDVGSTVDVSKVVDGDKSTGTNSPLGEYYSYVLSYDEAHIFTDIVVACNGKGTLASGKTVDKDTFNIKKIIVKVYYGEETTFESEILDVSKLSEIKVSANAKGDKVEIYKISGNGGRNEYMWEIETYAPDIEVCSAQVENVASEAVFSATGANANYWWAMNYKMWTDGDPLTGSRSPKGRNYSVWMHFSQEYLFSQIDIVCNTDGGARLIAANGTIDEIKDPYYGNGMMRVLVYNKNEDLVWDSDLIDTSTVTTLSVAPYVEGAIIEIRFFNGNFGGGEYIYEVSTYAQSGSHVFTQLSEENPTCLVPGFRELACHCGKVIKQSIPATGFHKWDDGVVTKGASDTSNGVLTVTCPVCESTKLYDVAATGHTWDKGVVVPPTCDVEGYTLYTCNCEGGHVDAEGNAYNLTYKGNPTEALVHKWDDGTVTKLPSISEEGVITYKCSVCNGEKFGRIRKHKYTDSTESFSASNIVNYDIVINTEDSLYNKDSYELEVAGGILPEKLFDGDMGSWWFAPAGSYFVANLDREYVFTTGLFFMSSNWSSAKIEFYNLNPDFDPTKDESEENPLYVLTGEFGSGNINDGCDTANPSECDMYDALKEGVRARKIKVTTIGAKWPNGNAAKLQELRLVVHKCEISPVDYILEGPDYVAPDCGTDGSCLANCQVCGRVNEVVIKAGPDVGHSYDDVIADTLPTCVDNGVGHAVCTKCNATVSGITIPATGEHKYTVDRELVSAKCDFAGVGQIVCEVCERVSSSYEIAPTGKHEYEWTTKSQAAYTAVGKTEYCCIYCDSLDPDTKENVKVAEKLEIPKDILTFVGASATSDAENGNVLSFTYKINLEDVAEIEKTCDIRVISTIKDAQGREASIESYGKYAVEGAFNAETGELTVKIYPKASSDEFEINTCIRVMNFRGIVYMYFPMGEYGTKLSMDAAK